MAAAKLNCCAMAAARSALAASSRKAASRMVCASWSGWPGSTTHPRSCSLTISAASALASDTRMTGRPTASRL